jgi:hypothetical protein
MRFLDGVENEGTDCKTLEASAVELVDFVAALTMGEFYSKRLSELVGPIPHCHSWTLGTPHSEFERWAREEHRQYVEKLSANRDEAWRLAVELLRYQEWPGRSTTDT